MKKTLILYAGLFLSFFAKAQDIKNLYLISGHPYDNTDEDFASYLWQYSESSLDTISMLSSKDDFLENVKVYPEQKLAVIHKTNSFRNQEDNHRLLFIDYRDSIRFFEIPFDIQGKFEYHLSLKNEIILLDMFSKERGKYFQEIDVQSLSIKESDINNFDEAKLIGIPGGAIYGDDYMLVYTNETTGTMEIPLVGDRDTRPKFPYILPERYQFHVYERHLVPVNNEVVFVVSGKKNRVKNELGSAQLIIYDKNEQGWSDVFIPGDIVHSRGFAEWIVGYVINDYIEGNKLPGAEKWTYRESGLSPKERWNYYPDEKYAYAPGILYFYNAYTKEYLELETNQADSEVILIQDDTVIYRVYDELYLAEIIKGKKLGKPKLLLKDDRVPDIHWAFFGGE